MEKEKKKPKRVHITIRTEQGLEALEDFKLFCMKKYGSMRSFSWGVESLIIHHGTYSDKIRSEQIQRPFSDGKTPEQVYKDMVDSIHQSDGYLINKTSLKTLIRRKFGVIDERTVRNWINKLVSEKYISVGTGENADRYIIRLNKLGVNEEEEQEEIQPEEEEPHAEEPAGLTEAEKGILYE